LRGGAQGAQQDISAIPVGFQAEFAAQFKQPENRFGCPAFHGMEDELSGYKDRSENTVHAFQGLDA